MNRLFNIFLLVLLVPILSGLASIIALSQNFEHLTVDDGLSQSTINCILQDSKGYIWFGTDDGLNKYNGYTFKIFQHNPLDTNSLSGNWILSIAEDKSGNLWLGTRSGLNKLEKNTGNIIRYLHNPYNPFSLSDNKVYGVYLDKKGYVWVKTPGMLNKLDPASGKFTHYEHYIDYFNITDSERSFPIIEDSEGLLWIGTTEGLNHFDRNYEQFYRFKHNTKNAESISNNYVTAICEDKYGNLWIGTKNGLNLFNKKTKKFKRYFHEPQNPNSLSNNSVISICEDYNGNLWIGTDGGLNMLVPGINQKSPPSFINYRHKPDNPVGISFDGILSIYEDNSNILWIGTDGGGINKIDLKKKKFQLYRISKGAYSVDLSANDIASFFIDDDNILWIGTWGSGLDLLNRKTGTVQHFSETSSLEPIPTMSGVFSPLTPLLSGGAGGGQGEQKGGLIVNDFVHVIFQDSNGKIWLGTRNGINIYSPDEALAKSGNKKTKKFTAIKDYIHNSDYYPNFKNNRINSIIEDKNKNIWIGSERGLHRINLLTHKIKSYYSKSGDSLSLSNDKIYSIVEDCDGFIWIGSSVGLNKYNPATDKFQQYKSKANSTNSLSNNTVYSVFEDYDGFIWIGTASGLNKLDKKNTRFTYYTQKDGLPNDVIYEILEDDNGDLWFSSNRGLAKFNKKTGKFRAFDKDDGLQSLEFNNGAKYKSKDGELFFGGISGFNSFYPDSIKDNEFIPKVVLNSLEKINRQGTQKYFIEDQEKIVLSYKDYTFTIDFAALEYTHPEKNNYMYMMEGLRDEWTNISTRNFVTFTDIPAGEYIFKVIGSNNDMVWNPQEASIKIIVKPHWSKTIWAYVSYVLVIVFLIFYFIRMRTRKLRNANQILREKQLAAIKIAEQKKELDDSINYAQKIQQAMLPSEQTFKKLLPNSFLLFKPRDIVSGDFYWIIKRNNKIFVAAVDCTGHGIPGAFMSIIGFDLLQKFANELGIEQPAQILNHLNNGIVNAFGKNIDKTSVRDGMDIAICAIDMKNNLLEYAGAVIPLYLLRNNKIIEIKGNRFSIGMIESQENKQYDNHIVNLKENDMIYLFSDGYVDQFGGSAGKKLMYKQFRDLLLNIHNLPMKKQKEILLQTIKDWQGTREQVDDILVMGIRI